MPDLKDAWMADRVPGLGKTFSGGMGGAGGANPVSGIIAAGVTGTPPASFPALPEPTTGKFMPPPGSSDRPNFFAAFKNATGFDGNTFLSGLPTASDGTEFSMSVWANFGVNNVPGFTPTPLQGCFYRSNGQQADDNGGFTSLQVLPGMAHGDRVNNALNGYVDYATRGSFSFDGLGYGPISGPALQFQSGGSGALLSNGIRAANTYNGVIDNINYPGDGSAGGGWVHLMYACQINPSTGEGTTVLVINDTILTSINIAAPSSPLRFSIADGSHLVGAISVDTKNSVGANVDYDGAGATTPQNRFGLYAAVAEMWVAPNRFIDWRVEANRYKFHASDAGWGLANVTYVPVDIGSNGARPFGFLPLLYLTGGPSQFVFNRANRSTLTVNGHALVAIDDPPG